MRRLFVLALGFASLVAAGCSSLPEAKTAEEVAYLRDVEAEPLEFTIPLLELDQAIDRTVDWLVRHERAPFTEADRAAFKEAIRSAGLGLIQGPPRYRVSDLGSHSYSVLFTLEGRTVRIAVSSEHESWGDQDEILERNARILVHYIRTGKEEAGLIG